MGVKGSLLIEIVQAMVSKLSCHPDPKYEAIIMNSVISLDAKSRKAHDFAAANVWGPGLCAAQQKNARCSTKECKDKGQQQHPE